MLRMPMVTHAPATGMDVFIGLHLFASIWTHFSAGWCVGVELALTLPPLSVTHDYVCTQTCVVQRVSQETSWRFAQHMGGPIGSLAAVSRLNCVHMCTGCLTDTTSKVAAF